MRDFKLISKWEGVAPIRTTTGDSSVLVWNHTKYFKGQGIKCEFSAAATTDFTSNALFMLFQVNIATGQQGAFQGRIRLGYKDN